MKCGNLPLITGIIFSSALIALANGGMESWNSADASYEVVGQSRKPPLPSLLTASTPFYDDKTTEAYAISVVDKSPAVIITLNELSPARSILIKNRGTSKAQAGLSVWLSQDKARWEKAWTAESVAPAWKVDLPEKTKARYIKVGLEGQGESLELKWIKVFGEPLDLNSQELDELAYDGVRKTRSSNPHPQAQWFPEAGLGLFMHWGIHSVAGSQPSWSMFFKYGKIPIEDYLKLATQFNPSDYDPDKWFAAAAAAGFKYVVLTTRHHDGYALWPSAYGDFSTKQFMQGRDLLKPYVEAARKHGLKVGFYYSPLDWSFNPLGWPHKAFPMRDPSFATHEPNPKLHESMAKEEIQKKFDLFYAYVKGQVTELLTNYGEIDLIWWDGFDWRHDVDIHGEEMEAYVRKLQPGILINDRWNLWGKPKVFGDFYTAERGFPKTRPDGWWEFCQEIRGHWGYSPKASIRPAGFVLGQLARARAWGGNYLPNIGPAPDGTMPPDYYKLCEDMTVWMKHSGEAVGNVGPVPKSVSCNVPVTVKDAKTWYFLSTTENFSERSPAETRHIEASGTPEPAEAILLRTGEKIPFTYAPGKLVIAIPSEKASHSVDAVKVFWK